MSNNTTTITGNLTREPEIRYTKEGQATTQLGVAVNRRWQDRATQEWQEAVSFFDVVCWRDLAENVALSLSKGMRVIVTGRLEQRSWETEDGEHRSNRSRSRRTRSDRACSLPPLTCGGPSAVRGSPRPSPTSPPESLATSAAFFGGLPAMFTVSIIEGATMHHTTDLTNSDRVDLARISVGAFLAADLRREIAAADPIGVVRAWENAVRTGDDKTALVDLVTDVLHLADQLGFRPSDITYVAQKHYDAEILEER
jgi:single-strand DNA-binding protein